MTLYELQRDELAISTDPTRLDVTAIHAFLSERSYWAQGRPRAVVEQAIANSRCYGVYAGQQLVGFARMVTDYCTIAWLADVFILESHRGRGLGKWLIESIVADPELQAVRRMILATRDAQGLYRQYGFEEVNPGFYMTRVKE